MQALRYISQTASSFFAGSPGSNKHRKSPVGAVLARE